VSFAALAIFAETTPQNQFYSALRLLTGWDKVISIPISSHFVTFLKKCIGDVLILLKSKHNESKMAGT
jgi:hypothetical protein